MAFAVEVRAGLSLLLIGGAMLCAGCTAAGRGPRDATNAGTASLPETAVATLALLDAENQTDEPVARTPARMLAASATGGTGEPVTQTSARMLAASATTETDEPGTQTTARMLAASATGVTGEPVTQTSARMLAASATGEGPVDLQSPDSVPAPALDYEEAVLVEFTELLSLAAGRNPQAAFAHERIREAFAQLQEAQLLWLPSLRAGLNYHKHDGTIQTSQGQILDTSRNSFFAGFGSRVVGGGSVGVSGVWMQFHLADAVFQPQIADRAVLARQQGARATMNDTLLSVALAYVALLQALQEQAVAEETLKNINELSEQIAAFAETGLAPQADVDRMHTESAFRQNLLRRSQEAVAVASSRLVRLLSGDQSVLLVPVESALVPIELIAPAEPTRSLVQTGLLNRPELHEAQALVSEAVQRLNREKYAPLIPSVLLGMTYGGLGGGLGNDFRDWGDRFDFDVAAWCEVRQFGLGERAIRTGARSRVEQARWRQVQTMDLVAQEVTEAHAQVRLRFDQIAVAQQGVEYALDSHRRNLDRIRQGEGLPIEVLQSVQALDATRREYVRAIAEYNEAQFRLYRALGWPIVGGGQVE